VSGLPETEIDRTPAIPAVRSAPILRAKIDGKATPTGVPDAQEAARLAAALSRRLSLNGIYFAHESAQTRRD
jgi:hypothetical protein